NLREYLHRQLSLTQLEPRDRNLVAFLIEALDEGGYLTQPIEELAQLVPEELQIEPEELAIALKHLQNFDPTGVGARSCAECLELQLLALPESQRSHATAFAIAHELLELLAARDFSKLRKVLQCGDDELRQAQRLIQSLNPRPGAAFSTSETRYIVPDVVVKKIKNVWVASLNPDALPKLRINRMYADILQNNRSQSGGQLSHQLQEARWLIKNVQQRFETILRVSQAIVDRQRHFFEHGEVGMRPLVLREIANTLGLHESTVSRVTTQKFMFTPRGIFELKYFFGSHVVDPQLRREQTFQDPAAFRSRHRRQRDPHRGPSRTKGGSQLSYSRQGHLRQERRSGSVRRDRRRGGQTRSPDHQAQGPLACASARCAQAPSPVGLTFPRGKGV